MKEENKRAVMVIGICAIVLLALGSLAKATTVYEEQRLATETYYEYDPLWTMVSVLIVFSLVIWIELCRHWNGRA